MPSKREPCQWCQLPSPITSLARNGGLCTMCNRIWSQPTYTQVIAGMSVEQLQAARTISWTGGPLIKQASELNRTVPLGKSRWTEILVIMADEAARALGLQPKRKKKR